MEFIHFLITFCGAVHTRAAGNSVQRITLKTDHLFLLYDHFNIAAADKYFHGLQARTHVRTHSDHHYAKGCTQSCLCEENQREPCLVDMVNMHGLLQPVM